MAFWAQRGGVCWGSGIGGCGVVVTVVVVVVEVVVGGVF